MVLFSEISMEVSMLTPASSADLLSARFVSLEPIVTQRQFAKFHKLSLQLKQPDKIKEGNIHLTLFPGYRKFHNVHSSLPQILNWQSKMWKYSISASVFICCWISDTYAGVTLEPLYSKSQYSALYFLSSYCAGSPLVSSHVQPSGWSEPCCIQWLPLVRGGRDQGRFLASSRAISSTAIQANNGFNFNQLQTADGLVTAVGTYSDDMLPLFCVSGWILKFLKPSCSGVTWMTSPLSGAVWCCHFPQSSVSIKAVTCKDQWHYSRQAPCKTHTHTRTCTYSLHCVAPDSVWGTHLFNRWTDWLI